MEEIEDARINWTPVVGSGLKCVPGDPENCGDGFTGKQAKLNHPKGIAITSDGAMYIADGPNIRHVDTAGIIRTLVGTYSRRSTGLGIVKTTDFESCRVVRADMRKVQLHWPSGLALNLVESKLLFIDEGILFQITEDNQVERVLRCHLSDQVVRPVLDLAFSPKGQLHFITEDSNLYTVKGLGEPVLVRTDKMPPYGPNYTDTTGQQNKNNLDAGFTSALSIGADGTIYVADQAHLELKQVSHFIPVPNLNADYEVVFPATGEIYTFNRYGQHTFTKDLKSGKTLYTFSYTKNTSYGKLSKITDSAENKILFLRDYSSIVSTIENTQGKKCSLKINHLGRLVHFQEMENSELRLDYSDHGLLLAKTSATGLSALYTYDQYGRIERVIGETGILTNFQYQLSGSAIQVKVDRSNEVGFMQLSILRNEETGQVRISQCGNDKGANMKEKTLFSDIRNASYGLVTENGAEVHGVAWGIYPLLLEGIPFEGNLFRGPSFQHVYDKTDKSLGLSEGNRHEWKFGLLGDSIGEDRILDRQMWVNSSRVLALEFDQSLSREVIYNKDREPVFFIQYDKTGLPLYFIPAEKNSHSHSMNITYDRFNRIENWKWGERRGLQVSYGRNGFATELKNLEGQMIRLIEYNEYGQPSKISLASSPTRFFQFHYDLHGGLKSVETSSGTHHSFIYQHSIGFTKLVYVPPGSSSVRDAFVKYFNPHGHLESIWLPSDSGRVFYNYDFLQRPTQTLYSEGKIQYKHKSNGVTVISSIEDEFETTVHILKNGLGRKIQEKIEYNAKSGLGSAKFIYDYDSNFRPVSVKVRIGGNVLPEHRLHYSPKTGMLDQIGDFRIARSTSNETSIFDGVAMFTRVTDGYGQLSRLLLTVQAEEVFRLELSYQSSSYRVETMHLVTKNIGYSPVKNFTYDADGQLIMVDSPEPWKFQYDDNGNLRSLTYRGNGIVLEHNKQDRILRFGDGWYKYDGVGRVIQNAKEEHFSYNALSQLKRVWKHGRFDVEYLYDHESRLVGRKDNHGNLTQFFYSDVDHPDLVTFIYSHRENRLLHLVYDDAQRLIFFQVNRNQKYYVATDSVGTPMLIFNQYGQVVREVSRSPYGHIVYDSDPYFYLPIDYCGGIHDKVSQLCKV